MFNSDDLLFRCDIPLFEAYQNLQDHGEIYMTSKSNKRYSEKLFIAIPVDDFMPSLSLSEQVSITHSLLESGQSLEENSFYSSFESGIQGENSTEVFESSFTESSSFFQSNTETDEPDNGPILDHLSSTISDAAALFLPSDELPLPPDSNNEEEEEVVEGLLQHGEEKKVEEMFLSNNV